MAVSLWIVFAMNYVPSRIYISWLHWLLYIVPTVPANFDCRSNLDLIFACLGCLWEADPSEAQQWAICFVKNLQQQIIHGVLKVLQKGFLETRFHAHVCPASWALTAAFSCQLLPHTCTLHASSSAVAWSFFRFWHQMRFCDWLLFFCSNLPRIKWLTCRCV